MQKYAPTSSHGGMTPITGDGRFYKVDEVDAHIEELESKHDEASLSWKTHVEKLEAWVIIALQHVEDRDHFEELHPEIVEWAQMREEKE